MPRAADLIQSALEMLRVYRVGEIIADDDLARGFEESNNLIDSWSLENLICYANSMQSAALVVGKSAYTIGPGQDIDAPRPTRIAIGAGAAFMEDTQGNRYSVDVLDQQRWNMLPNLTTINSNIPDRMYYDPQSPFGIINVFPVPNISYTLNWMSWLPLTDFPDLWTPVDFPPGYERALKTNLALALEPFFPQAMLSPSLVAAARESKASVKRANIKENIALYDPAIVSRAKPSYNIYSGRYSS